MNQGFKRGSKYQQSCISAFVTYLTVPSSNYCVKSVLRSVTMAFSLVRVFPYSVQIGENTDEKKTPYLHPLHPVNYFDYHYWYSEIIIGSL